MKLTTLSVSSLIKYIYVIFLQVRVEDESIHTCYLIASDILGKVRLKPSLGFG